VPAIDRSDVYFKTRVDATKLNRRGVNLLRRNVPSAEMHLSVRAALAGRERARAFYGWFAPRAVIPPIGVGSQQRTVLGDERYSVQTLQT
jgi:hypothetical protein